MDRIIVVRRQGFTLIEVLIASTILFASLTVISEAYRASVIASQKASLTAELLTPLPAIADHVKEKLMANPVERVSGDGRVLGVSFAFEAQSRRFVAPASRFDPDSGARQTYSPRYRLYDVKLDLKSGRIHRSFRYQELAWIRELE